MEPVYHSVLDPMVALGFLAAATQRIRLGVAVVNMPYVSPSYLAKLAAIADVLSRGRHDLGLGIGWMPEEFTVTGATMAAPRRADRRVPRGAAPGLGRRGDRVQRPVLPGAAGPDGAQAGAAARAADPARPASAPAALQRAGRLADGWVTSSRTDLSRISEGIAVVRGGGRGGRPRPGAIRIVCRGVVRHGAPVTVPEGGGRLLLSGSYADIRADADWLAEPGRHRALLRPELGPADRLARRRPGRRAGPGRGDPHRTGPAASRFLTRPPAYAPRQLCPARGPASCRRGEPGLQRRWRPPRSGWPRPAWPGCWTRARWPSWAR